MIRKHGNGCSWIVMCVSLWRAAGQQLSLAEVNEDVASTYLNQLDIQTKELFLPFQCFCSRRGVWFPFIALMYLHVHCSCNFVDHILSIEARPSHPTPRLYNELHWRGFVLSFSWVFVGGLFTFLFVTNVHEYKWEGKQGILPTTDILLSHLLFFSFFLIMWLQMAKFLWRVPFFTPFSSWS